jgi:nicotinamide-nucleotide amidase
VRDSGDRLPDDGGLGAALREELVRRGMTLATAESLTGGVLADLVSAPPGASEAYLGGVVSYATEVKVRILGVRERTVQEFGVVSQQCAREMAEGVRRLLGADWGVSTTGVAGPTTQDDKPVGTVFLAVAGPQGTTCLERHFEGDRLRIRDGASLAAARLVLQRVAGGSR